MSTKAEKQVDDALQAFIDEEICKFVEANPGATRLKAFDATWSRAHKTIAGAVVKANPGKTEDDLIQMVLDYCDEALLDTFTFDGVRIAINEVSVS
jgi:hypothetical protein